MLVCAGCEVTPDPISQTQYADRVRTDLISLRSREFTPTKPITLHEAMARAVAHNLKRRVSYIERRIAEAELEQNNYEMLPTLELSAGKDRSDVQISSSDDRITQSANATFTWNFLDLGVSYARAKQQAEEVLIAKERERKALQDIIRQVNVSFWRAASGQRLMTQVKSLAKDLRTAMQASREMEKTRATDALTAVAFRREIVDSVRKALAVQRELNEAKAELAELLNIRPGRDFELALPATQVKLSTLPLSIEEMERHSLQMRPELRIEDYNERISEWQAREALYDMLPGLDLSVAKNYSSESSNLSPNWISTGFHLGMNLFNLFSGSSKIESAEKRGELAKQQRLAMSVAVLTQVHIAHSKYREAEQQMRLVSEIAESDRRLARLVRSDGKFWSTSFLEAVRLETRHLQSEMDQQRAQIDLVSAHADLMHAIGLDAVPDTVPLDNLVALERTIASMLARWEMPKQPIIRQARAPLDQLVNSMISEPVPKKMSVAETARTAPEMRTEGAQPPRDTVTMATINRLNRIAPSVGAPSRPLKSARPRPLDWEVVIGPQPPPRPVAKGRKMPRGQRYFVALGAYRDQSNAAKHRSTLLAHSGLPLNSNKINVELRSGKNGLTYYYVQTQALKDRNRARDLCQSFKQLGHDCFVDAVNRF